ncbi:MAG: DNA-binding protein WhiA, partial [Ureaplasma sp.]|nr:DNA-binding protein WhiA [Ureaplasma sp.]
ELIILISNQKTLKYNSTKYKVIVSPKHQETSKILSKINLNDIVTQNQKQAFISGLFLSSGSISNPFKSNYHLEFRISNLELFDVSKKILNDFKIKFLETFHHKKHVIYIKKIQDISDMLKIFNANNNMFLLEEHRIESDFVNTCQRLNNLDVSNLSKTINANNEINHIITEIKKTREYYSLSDNLKKYCEIKLQNPTLTMNELVEVLNKSFSKPITKSWINHINIKLRKIYKKYN